MSRAPKIRADELLVARGCAPDVRAAQALIMAQRALWTDRDGRERKIAKAGERVEAAASVRILGDPRRYVSRAGEKLEAALDAFGIDPTGQVCADIGISTGGFTDCLLARGARRVHGVDVAYGILDWTLRKDPRLRLYERTNARNLPPGAFGEAVTLAVIDVSFIALEQVLPAVVAQLAPVASIVALVKPQFELPREAVEGGVVRDPAARQAAADRVAEAARRLGLVEVGMLLSPVPGADGNVEILLHLRRNPAAAPAPE